MVKYLENLSEQGVLNKVKNGRSSKKHDKTKPIDQTSYDSGGISIIDSQAGNQR